MSRTCVSFLVTLTALLSFGCAGEMIVADRPYMGPPFEGGEVTNVRVNAAYLWRYDKTIRVDVGDELFIEADGTWNGGADSTWRCTAEGQRNAVTAPVIAPEFPPGALVARIGPSGVFLVGAQEYVKSTHAGDLAFSVNGCPGWEGAFSKGTWLDVKVRHKKATGDPSMGSSMPESLSAATDVSGAHLATKDIANKSAVVIGLSDYKYRGKWNLTDLRYASRDAEALATYLKSPEGGRFDQVMILTDDQATTLNVRRAMKEQLRGVQEDDMVVVFWSGHGSPDPHDLKSLYLITHDTDPAHMASTAYPMAEFQRDLNRLEARNVIVMADTCHSGGISDPAIGLRGPGDNLIVDVLRGIGVVPAPERNASAPPMRLMFTSCEQGELARESSELGGGHGVFTWFLLQGLGGDADNARHGGNSDGRVNLGELIEYTRDQVKRHTGNQQHPDTAGSFDRELVIGHGG